jgi:hypothetical protein
MTTQLSEDDWYRDTQTIRDWVNGGGVGTHQLHAELRKWADETGKLLQEKP